MTSSLPSAARERARDARRQALLEAAEALFAERGFAGATMAAIARRAGYSAGHLYNIFENKEALFREVVAWRGEEALARLPESLSPERPFGEALEAFVRACLAFFDEHRRFFVFYIQATSGLEWNAARLGPDSLRVQQGIEQAVEQRLRQAQERGEIDERDTLVATCAVLGTLHHYLTRWVQSEATSRDLWAHEAALVAMLRRLLGVRS